MRLGHVAVVSQVLTDRVIQITHANWSPIEGSRGKVEQDVTIIDVSTAGDWSQVKVWYDPNRDLGGSTYATHGFIYPDAKAKVLASSGFSTAENTAIAVAQSAANQMASAVRPGDEVAHTLGTSFVPGCARGCVRDSRPEGRGTAAPTPVPAIGSIPGAAGTRRRWQRSYRCLRRAKPGPERSGGTRPDPPPFPPAPARAFPDPYDDLALGRPGVHQSGARGRRPAPFRLSE